MAYKIGDELFKNNEMHYIFDDIKEKIEKKLNITFEKVNATKNSLYEGLYWYRFKVSKENVRDSYLVKQAELNKKKTQAEIKYAIHLMPYKIDEGIVEKAEIKELKKFETDKMDYDKDSANYHFLNTDGVDIQFVFVNNNYTFGPGWATENDKEKYKNTKGKYIRVNNYCPSIKEEKHYKVCEMEKIDDKFIEKLAEEFKKLYNRVCIKPL